MLCDVGRLECAPHGLCFGVNAKAGAVLILETAQLFLQRVPADRIAAA